MLKSKEWLILNAVKAWLVHYEDKETELTPQYNALHKELYNAFITNETPVQKRGRPAKRQRTKKATSSTSSEEKS
jgi:23S rRNA maturation mini-RNase III